MLETQSRRPAILGAVAFAAVSWVIAAFHVAARDGFGSGDLPGFGFWSLLLAGPLYGVLRVFDRRSTNWLSRQAYFAAAVLGSLAGVAVTILVALILGGWIAAFSFPVLLCWVGGSLVAFVLVAHSRHPSSWRLSIPAVLLPILVVVAVLRSALAQPPDLIVYIDPEANPEQIETIWTDVLGTPSPSGRGHSHIEGVMAVSRFDSDTETRFRVAFRPGTSAENRAQIIIRVLASPLVTRTADIAASPSGEVRANLRFNPGRAKAPANKPMQTDDSRSRPSHAAPTSTLRASPSA